MLLRFKAAASSSKQQQYTIHCGTGTKNDEKAAWKRE